jgi:radical SAM superfamily enzyme YgiQ (UPF0313 family)
MELRENGSILLISCYELGHQPLGVAMPIGFLERAGYSPQALDIAVENFDPHKVAAARFVGISVPMHTAMRLGVRVAERIRETDPDCHICFYGLYAALNSDYLLDHGANSCIGGEFEGPLAALVEAVDAGSTEAVPGVIQRDHNPGPHLHHLEFALPTRTALPGLDKYAHLDEDGVCRVAGYVEATRGCLHLCTHCPIPPVYEGRFFAVPEDVVLEDIRRQVKAGATHISFGDPDFLNGPKHSLRIVRAMHKEFPALTFDFTSKIEHLLTRGEDLPEYGASGCMFIISAVESVSEVVLKILAKEHTHDDFVQVLGICRDAGIPLRPTWVAFTPWTTLNDYQDMLSFVETNGLIDHIDPVQFSIRLLIPPGSLLAEHPETLPYRGQLDEAAFTYRWTHPDPRMDELHKEVSRLVTEDTESEADTADTFYRIWELAQGRQPADTIRALPPDRKRTPRLTESWFC